MHVFNHIIVWTTEEDGLPSAVLPRITTLLGQALSDGTISVVNSSESFALTFDNIVNKDKTLVLCIGTNEYTNALISRETLESLGSESFHIRCQLKDDGSTVVGVNGRNSFEEGPRTENSMKIQPLWSHGNRGLAYGVYAALEELGFAFLHPLAPSIPPAVGLRTLNKFRAIHYHTQHPLELTPFLQGFGPKGVDDQIGWESQIPEFASFCEWLVANKQNGVEWPLLEGSTWMDWARSDVRIERLKRIVDVGHSYGIMIGVDVPIAFAQQHSFRLTKTGNGDNLEAEVKEIQSSLDWVMRAGFDFLGTESGTSEFTHTSPETMINWMNAAADYVSEKYDITMFIKVHYPRTGEDINYNMLPHFASPRLGVLPHTVEPYALDDPAPTYGNKDFKYIREYLNFELENGKRPVVFYPETCYWVSVDIDVPHFMPIYFERRFHDLRLLASDEDNSTHKNRMDGQLIFASGWEWGYWLNDALAARAAWNPFVEIKDEKEALRMLLGPLSRHMSTEQDQKDAEDLIIDWTTAEHNLLLLGKLEGKEQYDDISRKNGLGYIVGWDTWDDVSKIIGKLTQPDRLGLVEFKNGENWVEHVADALIKHKDDDVNVDLEYAQYVKPLLLEMDRKFMDLSQRTVALAAKAPAYTKDLWDDIADAGRMTALRIHQVLCLYEYVAELKTKGSNIDLAIEAMETLRTAQEIVKAREPRYRVEANRVACWTGMDAPSQPTACKCIQLLWTVRSLHFWWRDAAKALVPGYSIKQPSFANIIDPVAVGLGSGAMLEFAQDFTGFLSALGYPDDIKGWIEPKKTPATVFAMIQAGIPSVFRGFFRK
ncbi:hypothetical protein BCR33DRAFT_731394 [Rhizoclosmatium globosum]|uniref:Uncharacterized protein n=1 Tax=Rhizoclosmatium globosum TaxID=329046 RepID=A0A1Y1ZZJ8_9FUNG|nr:hypothetical protein BCR33DRAFT_731394 [Rhizoclosmatium globosum]|eukprot:ORY15656.1 hypothetical protein BCR33DRAFT_731394 [Rhizoclosmatium globosum]